MTATPDASSSTEPETRGRCNRAALRALSPSVPKFTALIQARSLQGLAETLRSARLAQETLVISAGNAAIYRLCTRHGARCKPLVPGVSAGAYAMDAFYDWLLLLYSGEQLTPELQQALIEWRHRPDNSAGYLIHCRDGAPQLRLVNRAKVNWTADLPPASATDALFPGAITLTSEQRAA